MPRRETAFDAMPIWQKMQFVQWLSMFPALTVAVFTRKNVGYRLLNPFAFLVMACLAAFIAERLKATSCPQALTVFGIAAFVAAIAARVRCRREMRRGVFEHSYYWGDSILEFSWLPGFFRRNRRFARLLDPLVCIVGGVALHRESPALGGWLILSGVCLRAVECALHKHRREKELDLSDGMIESEIQARNVERVRGEQHAYQGGSAIPTGSAPDIEQAVLNRTKRQQPPP